LAVSYLLFFAVLMALIGLLFHRTLLTILHEQTLAALESEWVASRAYLRFEDQSPLWFFDRVDPEESLIVNRIRRVYMISDANGTVLERSDLYAGLGVDSLEHIRQVLSSPTPTVVIRHDEQRTPYMIRQASVADERGRHYFLAIGRTMGDGIGTVNQFTLRYSGIAPLLLTVAGVLGWLLAGRALSPVNSVASTAHEITGSNLNVQIPLRGAGDELDDLIEAFNRMIGRLNQSFEQMRRFSTDVSHELRTPLTAIRGQLEVALFTAKTPEQYQEAMVNALQDVEQLSNIVRALLLLSQAESGQLALHMSSVNLSAVAHDVVEQFQIPAEASAVELEADLEPACIVHADRTQLERLLSNLLSNAVKYTPEGGRVRVSVLSAAGEARISVEDTGIGIPAEQLPHIFDRFYRVRPATAKPVQGLGLGLSFVSWIVEAHGGRVEVESAEGKGSRFTVWLPRAPDSPRDDFR
jgi:heavy metal sensor kinase